MFSCTYDRHQPHGLRFGRPQLGQKNTRSSASCSVGETSCRNQGFELEEHSLDSSGTENTAYRVGSGFGRQHVGV